MRAIAIIPARGGSKGIKRKNLAEIGGKPMIAWSIAQARATSLIDRVIVSTEDDEIQRIAEHYGAEVPFTRPRELAEDHVLDLPVFEHALAWLKENQGYEADIVVHLRPTAPLRRLGWIADAVEALAAQPAADSVRSVSAVHQHPYRMFRIGANGFLDPIMGHEHPQPYLLRRQDLPPVYYYNCVVDITRPATIFGKRSMTGDRILPYVIDPEEVFDVDSPRDLDIVRQFADRFR